MLGVPDPFWGEVGIAVCVAREGTEAVAEAELADVAPRLAAAWEDAQAMPDPRPADRARIVA